MNNNPLVINLIGGPGSGKSTTMAGVFCELKKRGVNCEMVPEYAKDRVYEEAFNTLQDQIYVFAKQSHKIWCLKDKVDIIVMDASLLTIPIYDKTHNSALKKCVIEEFNRSEKAPPAPWRSPPRGSGRYAARCRGWRW